MANIQLEALYDQKQREFSTQNQGGNRFTLDFIDATNRSIDVINRDADLASRIARITDLEDSVGLDSKYEDVLSNGVSLNLMMMGRRPSKGAETLVRARGAMFEEGIAGIQNDLRNAATDADTDDSTAETIGLGPLG